MKIVVVIIVLIGAFLTWFTNRPEDQSIEQTVSVQQQPAPVPKLPVTGCLTADGLYMDDNETIAASEQFNIFKKYITEKIKSESGVSVEIGFFVSIKVTPNPADKAKLKEYLNSLLGKGTLSYFGQAIDDAEGNSFNLTFTLKEQPVIDWLDFVTATHAKCEEQRRAAVASVPPLPPDSPYLLPPPGHVPPPEWNLPQPTPPASFIIKFKDGNAFAHELTESYSDQQKVSAAQDRLRNEIPALLNIESLIKGVDVNWPNSDMGIAGEDAKTTELEARLLQLQKNGVVESYTGHQGYYKFVPGPNFPLLKLWQEAKDPNRPWRKLTDLILNMNKKISADSHVENVIISPLSEGRVGVQCDRNSKTNLRKYLMEWKTRNEIEFLIDEDEGR